MKRFVGMARERAVHAADFGVPRKAEAALRGAAGKEIGQQVLHEREQLGTAGGVGEDFFGQGDSVLFLEG
jgi:hypothetical protein